MISKRTFVLLLLLSLFSVRASSQLTSTSTSLSWTQIAAPEKLPPKSAQMVEAGKKIYFERCWFCHGEEGDGNGPVADYLDPRPRDFTVGMFKLRSTESGQLPLDTDLYRTITRGIPGTGMPEWGPFLSDQERWQVTYFIETFAQEFSDPEFDPSGKVVKITKEIPLSPESVAKGREVFEKAKCWECHGRQGRGNGQKSAALEDGWGFPLRIRNLTQDWKLKRGATPKDIFMTFSTGLDGTPMPSFADSLTEEERWHLANFVSQTIVRRHTFEKVSVEAKKVDGEIPINPDDPVWTTAPALEIPLAGQILARPRWHNPAVEMATLHAVYNEKEIGFLIVWDDPFKDEVHKKDAEIDVQKFADTYLPAFDVVERRPGNFRDSVALQFPARIPEGAAKPHFFRGDSGKPVNLWIWKSDLQAGGKAPVETYTATGFKKPPKLRPPENQRVRAKGIWKDGQWKVVMKRALNTEKRNDTQFSTGKLIPIAVQAWDGGNGEHGLLMSISTWHYVYLKPPVTLSLYLNALLGFLIAGAIEFWLIRKSKAGRA